jgi:alpha-tubulin suppressor-like RCC1 family protein
VSGISTAEELSCGNGFCCARLTNKSLKCWGRGDLGQLGHGATTNQNAPVSVSGISNAATVMAGESHACAITDDGAVYCWGQGTAKQLGNGGSSNSSSPVRVTNY